MVSILHLYLRSQAESEQGRWCGQGRRGGVGHISVKIKLTTFCMHLTLFNQVQVDVHVEFCYLSVNGAEDLNLVHVHISSFNK